MGIETLIMAAVGAAVGGGISKASGGSFWKGAGLGALTGGIGVGVDRATGGNITGKTEKKAIGGITYSTGSGGALSGAPSTEEEKAARNRYRSLALLSTSPGGVLGNAKTGRRTLLGN